MAKEIIFKGEKAIELHNKKIKVVILPQIGGKIASLYHKEKEFEFAFQNKENTYKRPKLYSSFAEFDAAGLDDAFPTIDQCTVNYHGKEVIYPDHGEIWTSSFQVESIMDNKVTLKYESEILPYTYHKIIELKENSEVEISYDIKNNGVDKIPCIFAAHFLVNCHQDMIINFPKGTEQIVNVQPSERLGSVGTVHEIDANISKEGTVHESLLSVLPAHSNNTEKYYVKDKVKEGRCSILYKHVQLEYILKYDKEKLPYLGFWVTEGGFRGDYNCALEPTNGYYDSIDIAERENKLYYINPKESLRFNIVIEIKE